MLYDKHNRLTVYTNSVLKTSIFQNLKKKQLLNVLPVPALKGCLWHNLVNYALSISKQL